MKVLGLVGRPDSGRRRCAMWLQREYGCVHFRLPEMMPVTQEERIATLDKTLLNLPDSSMVVVSNVRYITEVDHIHHLGGKTLYLNRAGLLGTDGIPEASDIICDLSFSTDSNLEKMLEWALEKIQWHN